MDSEKGIILSIIASSAMMFLLVLVIILFVVYYSKKIQAKESSHELSLKNKELELLRVVIKTQESEREKIAANLHDEVGPLLSTLKLNISKHKKSLSKNILTNNDLDTEREFIDIIIDNVRTACHHLTPQFVLKYGLIKGLKNFITPINYPVITLNSNLENENHLSKQIILNVYRIGLELINNAIKHGKPKKMKIEIMEVNDLLYFKLYHNGVGLNENQFNKAIENKNGLGLSSIESRIIILNGDIKFHEQSNESITTLTIPLRK